MTVKADDFNGLSIFADYAKDKFLHGVLFYSGDKVLPFRKNGGVFHALPLSSLSDDGGKIGLVRCAGYSAGWSGKMTAGCGGKDLSWYNY